MVAPTIQDDTGDVAPSVKSGHRKHLRKLLADLTFEITEGRGEYLRAALAALFGDGQARIEERHDQGQDGGESGPMVGASEPNVAMVRTSVQ